MTKLDRKDLMARYAEGQVARRRGKSLSDNPYGVLDSRTAWETGWQDQDDDVRDAINKRDRRL